MKMMKRFTSVLLVLCMVLSLVPAITFGASAATATYKKVTAAPSDWSGTYLIVYENDGTAYIWTGIDAGQCHQDVAITNDTITVDATATVTIAKMTGGYSIKVNGNTNDGKYL